jgi:hypothetical protein
MRIYGILVLNASINLTASLFKGKKDIYHLPYLSSGSTKDIIFIVFKFLDRGIHALHIFFIHLS